MIIESNMEELLLLQALEFAVFWCERFSLILALINEYCSYLELVNHLWPLSLLIFHTIHLYIFVRRLRLVPNYHPFVNFDYHLESPPSCMKNYLRHWGKLFYIERVAMIISLLPFLDASLDAFGPCAQLLLGFTTCLVFYCRPDGKLFYMERLLMILTLLPYLDDNFGAFGICASLPLAFTTCIGFYTLYKKPVATTKVGRVEEMMNPNKLEEIIANPLKKFVEETITKELSKHFEAHKNDHEHDCLSLEELHALKELEVEKEHLKAKLQMADETLAVYRENKQAHEQERKEWETEKRDLIKQVYREKLMLKMTDELLAIYKKKQNAQEQEWKTKKMALIKQVDEAKLHADFLEQKCQYLEDDDKMHYPDCNCYTYAR